MSIALETVGLRQGSDGIAYGRMLSDHAHALALRLVRAMSGDDHAMIRKDAHGRPYVVSGTGAISGAESESWVWSVSISHADGLIACAVHRGGRVGIDVESVRRPTAGVLRHCFSPRQCGELHDPILSDHSVVMDDVEADTDMLAERTTMLWTLKEAYGKYTGLGLADCAAIRACDLLFCKRRGLAVEQSRHVMNGRRYWCSVVFPNTKENGNEQVE
ncbi:4'-phosphopantetheinyl transferase family protein [Bifidobacterium tissieri]|uniref:4'-phosphopantetheinyl transferase superfamily protein n=1 Tax=Bifidobacterium tissieri TaxID=1630162 RepID=A0A5M9ZL45_9BIFI|nr:4'-phosphopantetheinyl transferase superfamily protein [Bifidobacterium tissieri]KAA8828279.1 4'-phosphopantetheinyl transferase superfamily protein [Bifidobacterium tissieri]KAA8828294.1 4'-phosphopantetheinyl transferase superfamily protein [Bifidobacterium tissieri]